jgi:hypothetical protein
MIAESPPQRRLNAGSAGCHTLEFTDEAALGHRDSAYQRHENTDQVHRGQFSARTDVLLRTHGECPLTEVGAPPASRLRG